MFVPLRTLLQEGSYLPVKAVIVGMVLIDVVGVVDIPNPGEFKPKKLVEYFLSKGLE